MQALEGKAEALLAVGEVARAKPAELVGRWERHALGGWVGGWVAHLLTHLGWAGCSGR